MSKCYMIVLLGAEQSAPFLFVVCGLWFDVPGLPNLRLMEELVLFGACNLELGACFLYLGTCNFSSNVKQIFLFSPWRLLYRWRRRSRI